MELNFYLDHPRENGKLKNKEVALYLSLSLPNQRIPVNTGWKVYPGQWDFKKMRFKKQADRSKDRSEGLDKMKSDATAVYEKYRHSGTIELKQKLLEAVGDPRKEIGSIPISLDEFRKSEAWKAGPSTRKKFRSLKTHLEGFYKESGQSPTFNNLGMKFYDAFLEYLYNQPGRKIKGIEGKMLDNTVAMYFAKFKQFLNWALAREYHKNIDFKKWPAVPEKKVDHPTLDHEELSRLYSFPFTSSRLERTRDLFCFH